MLFSNKAMRKLREATKGAKDSIKKEWKRTQEAIRPLSKYLRSGKKSQMGTGGLGGSSEEAILNQSPLNLATSFANRLLNSSIPSNISNPLHDDSRASLGDPFASVSTGHPGGWSMVLMTPDQGNDGRDVCDQGANLGAGAGAGDDASEESEGSDTGSTVGIYEGKVGGRPKRIQGKHYAAIADAYNDYDPSDDDWEGIRRQPDTWLPGRRPVHLMDAIDGPRRPDSDEEIARMFAEAYKNNASSSDVGGEEAVEPLSFA